MKNRSMDLLKYEPFPALAEALRERIPSILKRWTTVSRETLASAEQLTYSQLRDTMPETLAQMAIAIEATDPKATKDLMDQATSHGGTRYDQNYDIGELLIEYSVLRRIVADEVAAQLERELTIEEVQALNLGIDVAARRGVVTFITHQKSELQAFADAQTKYLSFLSHDLRGGLNGVLLMIEVLRRDLSVEPKFAQSLEDLEVMRRSILETVSTMDRFLHAERFRKGKVQIKPAPVDLKMLIGDIVNQLSHQARDKEIALQADVQHSATITSDRELIMLILQNLAANAIKYSNRGAVKIVAGKDCATDKVCRLSVIDQGPGIAEEDLANLFAPFSRGETHGQPGIGLGLSIARQAADLLGAKLWAESKVGEGSTFHLELPANPPSVAV